MGLGDFYKVYKAWKEAKRIGKLSDKTVGMTNRVDQLIRDYGKSNLSDKQLDEIKQRLRHLKGELALLAVPSPAMPKMSPSAIQSYLRDNLEGALVAEAARMELMRIYWAQDAGKLPDDGGPPWPPTRARYASGSKAFHQQAITLSGAANRLNRDIDEAQKLQDQLRSIQKDPYFTKDQLDDLEADYNESVNNERNIKNDQRRMEALAQAFENASINLNKLIEIGDEAYKAKK